MLLDHVNYKEDNMTDKENVISFEGREPTKMELLDQWLKELAFPGDVKNFIQEISGQDTETEVTRKFCFYTNNNQYFITAIERFGENDSYLGCQVSTRKHRAGEDWIRGNDLPDGPITKKTWNIIINAIINYELVKLSDYKKPDSIPENTA